MAKRAKKTSKKELNNILSYIREMKPEPVGD
jgi:hypothetical protein